MTRLALSDPLLRAVVLRTILAVFAGLAAAGVAGPGWGIGVGLLAAAAVAVSIVVRVDRLRDRVLELSASSGYSPSPPAPPSIDELARRVDEARRSLAEARRKAEQERDDVRGILEAANEGIIVVGHHHRIELINEAARRILAAPADPLGRSLAEIAPGSELLELAEALRRGEEPAPRRLEMAGLGGPRWVHLSGAQIRGDRLRNRAVLVLHDATDLQHLERVRTDFVANVTHEMRSPLASILGYAETLVDLEAFREDESRDFLDRILRNSRRLDDIIRDLIELSRLEHSTAPEVHPTDVAELVAAVCAPFAEAAAEKGVAFAVETEALHGPMDLDQGLVRQALTNLVDNAVKYTPREGEVRVSGRLLAPEESGLPTLELSVSDTGPGIRQEHQGRIFERFYRVDTARSRALGGTGLGLAIVKHAAALHGGSVKVVSEADRGTTFRLFLAVGPPSAS